MSTKLPPSGSSDYKIMAKCPMLENGRCGAPCENERPQGGRPGLITKSRQYVAHRCRVITKLWQNGPCEKTAVVGPPAKINARKARRNGRKSERSRGKSLKKWWGKRKKTLEKYSHRSRMQKFSSHRGNGEMKVNLPVLGLGSLESA